MAFYFESVTDQSKKLVFINVHALSNTLDIKTNLLVSVFKENRRVLQAITF